MLAENDNCAADPGSGTLFDSFLQYTFDADGTYFIQVAKVTGVLNGVTTVAPPNGNYALQVSVGGNNSSFDTATHLGNLGTAGQDGEQCRNRSGNRRGSASRTGRQR